MPYTLTFTPEDVRTVDFVGGRYAWSEALRRYIGSWNANDGQITLTESEAWGLQEAFERDAEGGHSYFPMLDPRSELAAKLHTFLESIV